MDDNTRKTELARPAVTWTPGMHIIDVDGDRGVIVHVVGQRLRISYGSVGSGRRWEDLLAWQIAHECTLDVSGNKALVAALEAAPGGGS